MGVLRVPEETAIPSGGPLLVSLGCQTKRPPQVGVPGNRAEKSIRATANRAEKSIRVGLGYPGRVTIRRAEVWSKANY